MSLVLFSLDSRYLYSLDFSQNRSMKTKHCFIHTATFSNTFSLCLGKQQRALTSHCLWYFKSGRAFTRFPAVIKYHSCPYTGITSPMFVSLADVTTVTQIIVENMQLNKISESSTENFTNSLSHNHSFPFQDNFVISCPFE